MLLQCCCLADEAEWRCPGPETAKAPWGLVSQHCILEKNPGAWVFLWILEGGFSGEDWSACGHLSPDSVTPGRPLWDLFFQQWELVLAAVLPVAPGLPWALLSARQLADFHHAITQLGDEEGFLQANVEPQGAAGLWVCIRGCESPAEVT